MKYRKHKEVTLVYVPVELKSDDIPNYLKDRKDFGVIFVFLSGSLKEQREKQKKLNDFILSEDF